MEKSWTIGRKSSNKVNIVIDDVTVSALHATVRKDDCGNVFISDIGSTNGTLVERNGSYIPVVDEIQLKQGDQIFLGTAVLAYEKLVYQLTKAKSEIISTENTKVIRCSQCAKVIPDVNICPFCHYRV